MAIAIGGNQINKAYIGSTEVQKMYLGNNLVFDNTAVPLIPIMTNFRIENGDNDKVYFDTPIGPVTGLTTTGFTISGKTISGIDTVNNYFTVTSDFTFWSNNTIRLEGGNGVVYDFTQEYIINNINKPAATTDRYVDVGASGSGLSGDPMSITSAFSQSSANTTYWIKAGDYGSVNLVLGNSGQISAPARFVGYKTTEGDLDGVKYFSYGDTVSGADAPLISGSGSGAGLSGTRNYIIVENMQFNFYGNNVQMWGGETGRVYENCVSTNGEDANFRSSNSGNSQIRYVDCIGVNSRDQGLNISGSFNAAIRCESYCDRGSSVAEGQDYYIMAEDGSTNNMIVDCHIERFLNAGHSGHGYSIKGSSHTLVQNCIANGINAPFQLRHSGANNCVVKNSQSDGKGQSSAGGLVFRDGASNNTIENCKILNMSSNSTYGYISMFDSSEDGYQQVMENNIVKNCIFGNITGASVAYIYVGLDSNNGTEPFSLLNNKFYNNTFYGDSECTLFRNKNTGTISGNEFKNNVVDSVSTFEFATGASDGWTLDYNNFSNGFAAQGTNATTIQPNFVNLTDFVPQNNIDAPKILGVNYDIDGNERADITTEGGNEINTVAEIPFSIISYNISGETATTAVVQCYMTKQCSINYYVDGVKNAASSDNFDAGEIGPNEFRHTNTLTGLTPDHTANLIIEITAQDDGEIVQSGNIPLTTLPPTVTVSNTEAADFSTVQAAIDSGLVAGDIVGLKGGDEFYESVTINAINGASGNPITFTSYGTGKAVIKGSEAVTGWTDEGGNIWSSDVTGKTIYNVLKDGMPANNTRMPLPDMYTSEAGTTSSQVVSSELIGFPDIVGATIYAETDEWTIEDRRITSFDPVTGTAQIDADQRFDVGSQFTIHNHKNLLASQNDWAYESSTNTLYVYSTSTPVGITATTNATDGIYVNQSNYILINNINVRDYLDFGIKYYRSEYLTITNCIVENAMNEGMGCPDYSYGGYTTIEDNQVYRSGRYGIRVDGRNHTIKNNIIDGVNMLEDKTWTQSGYSTAIRSGGNTVGAGYIDADGNDSLITGNTIKNIGYSGITWIGERTIIEKNYIDNHSVYLPDGSGIYTYGASWEDTRAQDSQVLNNTIINQLIPRFRDAQAGIYFDDFSERCTAQYNTIEGSKIGVFLHNTVDCVVQYNNLYRNNRNGLAITEDTMIDTPVVGGNIVTFNNCWLEQPEMPYLNNFYGYGLFSYSYWDNIVLGAYDNNRYYNPYSRTQIGFSNETIWWLNSQFKRPMTLAQWQAIPGQTNDVNSTEYTEYWGSEYFYEAKIVTPTYQEAEQVTNPDFSGGDTSAWDVLVGAKSAVDIGGGDFVMQIIGSGSGFGFWGNAGYRLATDIDELYCFEFDAYCSVETLGSVSIQELTGYQGENYPVALAPEWRTFKYIFKSRWTRTNIRPQLTIADETSGTLQVDNISFRKVTVADKTLDQRSFLAYNETSVSKIVTLPTGTWQTLDGVDYTGTITIAAYSSEILIKQ